VRFVGVRRVSAGGDERLGHATRRPVIAGVLAPRGVRAGMDAGRTRAAEGHGRRLILCTRNRTDPISGFANNGDAPDHLRTNSTKSIELMTRHTIPTSATTITNWIYLT